MPREESKVAWSNPTNARTMVADITPNSGGRLPWRGARACVRDFQYVISEKCTAWSRAASRHGRARQWTMNEMFDDGSSNKTVGCV